MAEISIAQGAVQSLQPAPQAAVPTVDSGNASEIARPDQVVNVSPRVNEDGNGQAQQGGRENNAEVQIAENNEQASASAVLRHENEEANVVVRLRYSVSEERVYLEIVDLDTNATVGRIPRESVIPPGQVQLEPENTERRDEANAIAQNSLSRAAVTDVNETLARFFEQQ